MTILILRLYRDFCLTHHHRCRHHRLPPTLHTSIGKLSPSISVVLITFSLVITAVLRPPGGSFRRTYIIVSLVLIVFTPVISVHRLWRWFPEDAASFIHRNALKS